MTKIYLVTFLLLTTACHNQTAADPPERHSSDDTYYEYIVPNDDTLDEGQDEEAEDVNQNPVDEPLFVPEIDPSDFLCNRFGYSEPLPRPSLRIPDTIPTNVEERNQLVYDLIRDRLPQALEILDGALQNTAENCVTRFSANMNTREDLARQMPTLVHECGHFWWFENYSSSDAAFAVAPGIRNTCSGGGPSTQFGRSFARGLIRNDAEEPKWPPCAGAQVDQCDIYADTYLGGDPADAASVSSGGQGFDSLFEEVLEYVNGLSAGIAFEEYFGDRRISIRDGVSTTLWYLARYLNYAKVNEPSVYELLSEDPCWRESILIVWARGMYFLNQANNLDKLSIVSEDVERLLNQEHIQEVFYELQRVHGCR